MNAGQQLSIKPTDPSDALQPSLYFLIDFNGGGGGTSELNGWIDGSIPVPPVACGNMIEVEKGNKVGLKHGIDDLLGDPPDDLYAGMPGDTGHYLINGTVPSNTSKALVSVPIWDTCGSGFCGTGIPKVGGHQQVAVLGWALMFLEGMAGPGKDDAGRKTDQHYGMWVRGHAADRFECISGFHCGWSASLNVVGVVL